MKKLLTLLTIIVFPFVITGNLAYTNGTGAPAGKTGSPGDGGSSCNNAYCHGYSPQNSGEYVEILVNFPLNSNGAYRITIVAGNTGGFQYEKAGFQACVEDQLGNKIGQIILVNTLLTQFAEDQQEYITHTETGTAISNVNLIHMWEFDWLPPVDFQGEEAIIYAASMLTNNDETNYGDVHVTANYSFNVGFSFDEIISSDFSVYPNPIIDEINMSFVKNLDEDIVVVLHDLKGLEVVLYEGKLNQKEHRIILPSEIVRGIYTLSVYFKQTHSLQKIFIM